MQTPVYSASQSLIKVIANSKSSRASATDLLDTRLADFIRNLFVSSLLWGLLAFAIYSVYSMIAGSH